MIDNNGWPDKPGVPMNPERDGPHWLGDPDSDRAFVVDWSAAIGWLSMFTQDTIAAYMRYIAPCLTPAEVDARIAKARKDGMKDAAKWHEVRSMELSGKAGVARNFRQLLRQSDFHMESAAEIRALAKGDQK
jgi:hypothetical protein